MRISMRSTLWNVGECFGESGGFTTVIEFEDSQSFVNQKSLSWKSRVDLEKSCKEFLDFALAPLWLCKM